MKERNINLICRRTQMGYTQVGLAKKMQELGECCEQVEISKYENGILKPRMDRAKKIAQILNCKIDDIF